MQPIGTRQTYLKRVISLFQTATGSWHWPSILTALGLFAGFVVAAGFMFANLAVNRRDRLAAYERDQKSAADAESLKTKIADEDEARRAALKSLDEARKKSDAAQQQLELAKTDFDRRIAEAESRAMDVQSRTARRSLSDSQKAEIRVQLRAVSGQNLNLNYMAQDAECNAYAEAIAAALSEAGLKLGQVSAVLTTGSIEGVQVHVRDGQRPPPLANILLQALNAAGIPAKGIQNPSWPDSQQNQVTLWVGSKP